MQFSTNGSGLNPPFFLFILVALLHVFILWNFDFFFLQPKKLLKIKLDSSKNKKDEGGKINEATTRIEGTSGFKDEVSFSDRHDSENVQKCKSG